ncbi:MAG: CvpA family protein, partial [Chloroflexales bacterium]|nr:CvpA family protein [Chloroflexales bacterium]
GWLDHLLGGVLGLAQAILAAAVLVTVMVAFPIAAWSDAVASSAFAAPLLRIGGVFSGVLPELFGVVVRASIGW